MRTIILSVVLVFISASSFAQAQSPEALYERGLDAISGANTSRNDHDAIEYFRQSADQGYAPAQVALGYLLDTGTLIAGSQTQAVDWYKRAASQGDTLASWMLGRRYYLGGGVPQDIHAAQKWLEPAAEQGNPFAAYFLGRLMADTDYTKAPALFKVAAEQGIPPAQYYYAKALKDGRGITADRFQAYIWFMVALDAGYSPARADLADLDTSSNISHAQADEAKSKARELEQTVSRAVVARGCTGWDGEFDEWPTAPPVKLQRFCR